MLRQRRLYLFLLFIIAALISGLIALQSQTTALIRDRIDETRLVTLTGNTRPEANAANDLGPVSDDLPLDHILLQLKRSPAQEQAAEQTIADLHHPASPRFHKWMTAAGYGASYGLAQSDLRTITQWLESRGFTVNFVYPSGVLIDFSGNAGQVRQAFHASIHNLNVNGVRHIANFSDPQIPAALAPVVAGIVSLHDFHPNKKSRVARPRYTFNSDGQSEEAVVPADLATIYDFNPVFTRGITGAGQTVVVLEDTDLYRSSDWTTFRSAFGLSQYTSGSLTTVHPTFSSSASNCSSPGVNSDDDEAILDAEWATAAAPSASIELASCASTAVTFGVMIAGQNLVNSAAPPPIMSISYGECEAENGAAANAAINSLYQQAVAEGVSVFVAAGDEGAASCDAGAINATHGIAVSSQASTQYNVAVGGTDFSDTFSGTNNSYWSQTNSSTWGSALSYIPEIPWNDSCAGSLVSQYNGYSTPYGVNGFCNSSTAKENELVLVAAGSGGPSNCFTGSPSFNGVASGSCQGYAKPAWQTGVSGISNDGVRDIPDVSMFASDGSIWGHYSVVCFTDPENGGSPCVGAPSNWSAFGGTSLASPVMAGIQALVNQNMGDRQGNPNTVYYVLAAKQPSVFHSITQGDIEVNCGGENCYGYLGTADYGRRGRIFGTTWGGVLSVSDTSLTPAYPAIASWSFANGLGSVDVNNLVTNWSMGQ